MQCTILLAQELPDPKNWTTLAWLAVALLTLFTMGGGAHLLYLRIQNEKRKKREAETGTGEQRRILPSPIVTRADDPPVCTSVFEEEIARIEKDLKERMEKSEKELNTKLEKHQTYVHQRFHDVLGEVGAVSLKLDARETEANQQFKAVEGKLGELKATSQHTNALAIRTQETVQRLTENLPGLIRAAVKR